MSDFFERDLTLETLAFVIVGVLLVALLLWASRSIRTAAYTGLFVGIISVTVGMAGYLACILPWLATHCVHSGALSAHSVIYVAGGIGSISSSSLLIVFILLQKLSLAFRSDITKHNAKRNA